MICDTRYARQPAQYVNTSIRFVLYLNKQTNKQNKNFCVLVCSAVFVLLVRWSVICFQPKTKNQKPKDIRNQMDEAGTAGRSDWWSSGSSGRWQRTSNTHSASTMFGTKDATAEFRIMVSSQMTWSLEHADAHEGAKTITKTSTRVGQRGGGRCGLGMHTA